METELIKKWGGDQLAMPATVGKEENDIHMV